MELNRPMKKLTRGRKDSVCLGICSGLGHYFGIDPVVVRILFIGLAVPYGIPLLIAYLISGMVIPKA